MGFLFQVVFFGLSMAAILHIPPTAYPARPKPVQMQRMNMRSIANLRETIREYPKVNDISAPLILQSVQQSLQDTTFVIILQRSLLKHQGVKIEPVIDVGLELFKPIKQSLEDLIADVHLNLPDLNYKVGLIAAGFLALILMIDTYKVKAYYFDYINAMLADLLIFLHNTNPGLQQTFIDELMKQGYYKQLPFPYYDI